MRRVLLASSSRTVRWTPITRSPDADRHSHLICRSCWHSPPFGRPASVPRRQVSPALTLVRMISRSCSPRTDAMKSWHGPLASCCRSPAVGIESYASSIEVLQGIRDVENAVVPVVWTGSGKNKLRPVAG